MKPSSFGYHAPDTVDEAAALLAELGDEAKVLAGGQSLVPMMSLRLAYFEHLIDIGRIESLRGIRVESDHVVIGATTLEATVERDPEIAAKVPLLARATRFIGHPQIRNRGTVGGSIAHADPAAEYPLVALSLGAEVEVVSVRGTRRVGAADLFDGLWTTSLEADELLTEVRFPIWSGRCGFSVHEFARRFGDFALAGAMVAVQLDEGGTVQRCAIGLLGLGHVPLRAGAAEAAARGSAAADVEGKELGRLAVADLDGVASDQHGSAHYRCRVGGAMVERAWNDAIREALGA